MNEQITLNGPVFTREVVVNIVSHIAQEMLHSQRITLLRANDSIAGLLTKERYLCLLQTQLLSCSTGSARLGNHQMKAIYTGKAKSGKQHSWTT